MYFLVDESGRFADPSDPYIVLVGVLAPVLAALNRIIKDARQRIPEKGKRRHERHLELKFSNTGTKTRKFVLERISKLDVQIYALVVTKNNEVIPDEPETYAWLVIKLMSLLPTSQTIDHLILDKRYTSKHYILLCNRYIQTYSEDMFIEQAQSEQVAPLALPDFAAGSIRMSKMTGKSELQELITKQIIAIAEINAGQIKKRQT